jgi:hypothetical protein
MYQAHRCDWTDLYVSGSNNRLSHGPQILYKLYVNYRINGVFEYQNTTLGAGLP